MYRLKDKQVDLEDSSLIYKRILKFKNYCMKKYIRYNKKIVFLSIGISILLLSIQLLNLNKEYKNYIYTPTSIEKINNVYFIVDCWQNRVIYNENLIDPIGKWSTVDDDFYGPHSIASDGKVLIVDDTDRQRLKVYKQQEKGFRLTQTINNVGIRPHKVIYDNNSKLFYCIASASQEIIALENTNGIVKVKYKKKLSFLEDAYVRSINIIDGNMYFVSGPNKVIIANYQNEKYNVIKEYKVSDELTGMNHIIKVGAYYYITIYTNKSGEINSKMLRVQNLEQLEQGKYEDLYRRFNFKGTPYYFSFIEDRIFITEIDEYSSIKSFKVEGEAIVDIKTHYDIGQPKDVSIKRKNKKTKF